MEIKVLEISQAPAIIDYEQSKLKLKDLSAEDQELLSWDAVWRQEALDHYLPQGWSFGVWEASESGLWPSGQPQRGHGQTQVQVQGEGEKVRDHEQGQGEGGLGGLLGYSLAQPLLFFRGITQSLWVEHMAFETLDVGEELMNIMVGWGRSKHIQKVLFGPGERLDSLRTLGKWKLSESYQGVLEVSTTKMSS